MTIKLSLEMEKIIQAKLHAGGFATAEDVVFAGLQSLNQQSFGDFRPGEMDELLAVAEESLKTEGALDGETVFAELRARRNRGGQP